MPHSTHLRKSPFEQVNSETLLAVTSPKDVDLEAKLQFVSDDSAVLFDFSAYVLVDDTCTPEQACTQISDEIHAFDALLDAVKKAHSDFLTKAFDAIDAVKQGAPAS